MYIATFDNSQSIFLVENQLKTLQSVTRNGRINYKGDHVGYIDIYVDKLGGGPRVVVSTAAFHARVRFPVSAVWKEQKCFFPIHVWKSVLWGASVTER